MMLSNTEEAGGGGVDMTDDTILSVESISIAFGGLQALSDVSVSVGSSEILGLIGPNGAGKTVLLNCMSGIYVPTRGSIHFEGIFSAPN